MFEVSKLHVKNLGLIASFTNQLIGLCSRLCVLSDFSEILRPLLEWSQTVKTSEWKKLPYATAAHDSNLLNVKKLFQISSGIYSYVIIA